MLTSLDFLKIGQQFPPICEAERLDKYNKNRLIFEGKHEEVYKSSFERISRVINNFDNVVSYSVIANFQKLVSLKIADFLLGESPKIVSGDDESIQQASIEKIKENSDLDNTLYTSAIDISRYGDSVLNVYKDEEGKGIIDITQPSFYFKVVDPKNIKKTLYHVLAHTYNVDVTEKSLFGSSEKTIKYLYVQIHYKGFYEETTLILNEQNIISGIQETVKRVETGLDDFAIIPVHNLLTSDRVYGIDDYADLDSIISEIEVRISQISKILDKHAEPSMQGPETALQYNPNTNQYELKTGNYFPRAEGDCDVSYITWEAQLVANFEHIQKLINILAVVSEMGSAIFDFDSKLGNAASGTALKRMMISPLAKVNRIRMRFDSAIKKSIKLCSQLGGENISNLSKEAINIYWNDGLPSDEREQAEIFAIRTGNKPTISQYSAIQRLDSLNDEDTQTELEAILEDEKQANPLSNMNFDYSKDNSGGGE